MTQDFDRSAIVALGKVNATTEGLAEPSVQDRYPDGVAIGCTSVCEFVLKEMEKVRRQFESAVHDWYRRRNEPRPHDIERPDINVDGFGSGAATPVFDLVDRIVTDIRREIAIAGGNSNVRASDEAPATRASIGQDREERRRAPAKPKSVNTRMSERIEKDHELVNMTAEWFATKLECNRSTVTNTKTWKQVVMPARLHSAQNVPGDRFA